MSTRLFVIAHSPETAERMSRVLMDCPSLVVGKLALHGEEVLRQLHSAEVDLVAIDASIPSTLLRELTSSIMKTHPLPLVILGREEKITPLRGALDALDIGALDVFTLPEHPGATSYAEGVRELDRNLRLMSEIKVVRRWDRARFSEWEKALTPASGATQPEHDIHIVAVGASAGGTKALQAIFRTLPADFSLPVLVVQHIARGYVAGLARWLDDQCALKFSIAEDGMRPQPGTVYLAPDDRHLTVAADHRILLTNEDSINGFKPSIARLFSSIHDTYGPHAAAVLLSGMGNDGAAEMRRLYDAGSCTIAQDKETSLMHGIPGEAIKLAAVRYILPLQEISNALLALTQRPRE